MTAKLPTFVVIGAMKAGTTSLHAYLRSHPDVFVAAEKELDFFVAEHNWGRGLDWYAARFAGAEDHAAVGEISPNYTKSHLFGGVADRIHDVLPVVRLVYVVRDPIARMRSHYVHALGESGVRMPLREAMLEHDHLALCSSYAHQLEPYLRRFPREQLLILTAERLRERRREELARLFRFLGVDDAFEPRGLSRELHRGDERRAPRSLLRRRPGAAAALERRAPARLRGLVRRAATRQIREDEIRIPPDVEAELRRRFEPDIARLRELAGDHLRGWPPP